MGQVRDRLIALRDRAPATQLGVGVVSRLTVEATIELANSLDIDLMLIASRRQNDMDSLGSGYVEGWNAARLVDFVRLRDAKSRVLVCRDHGGPYQNTVEHQKRYTPEQAMQCARDSFAEDIEAGFDLIHIDTSVQLNGAPPLNIAMDRLFALWQECADIARRCGRDVAYEVGAEEQDWVGHPVGDVKTQLEAISTFCQDTGEALPAFIVAQTGTKVMETRNIGCFGTPFRLDNELPSEVFVPKLVQAVHSYGVMLKQHNTDYLPDDALRRHPWYYIDAANVAPEFGVVESRAFLHIVEARGLTRIRDTFLDLAYSCGKWKKWMLPETTASDRERAIICGHYTFSTPDFKALAADLQSHLNASGLHLDTMLKDAVKGAILRYITAFRLRSLS